MRMDQYLAKIWTKVRGLLFWATRYNIYFAEPFQLLFKICILTELQLDLVLFLDLNCVIFDSTTSGHWTGYTLLLS